MTDVPDDVEETEFGKKEDGTPVTAGFRWDGDAYDPRQAWIVASIDALVNLRDRENPNLDNNDD